MKKPLGSLLSERRFQAMIENTAGINMLTCSNGTIEYISPSCIAVLGIVPESQAGRNVMDHIEESDRPLLRSRLERLEFEPGVPLSIGLRWRTSDHSIKFLNCVVRNRMDDPTVNAFVWNYRDQTTLKINSAELSRSQATLKAVLDSSEEAICSIDKEQRIVSFNTKLDSIMKLAWGFEIQEGMRLHDRLSAEEAAFWTDVQTRALRGEMVKTERYYSNPYGKAIVEFSIYPIVENDAIIGASAFGKDVTEQRKILEEIQFQASLLAQTSDLIVAVDMDGRVTYWNGATERLFGIPAAVAIGKRSGRFFKAWTCKDSPATIEEKIATMRIWNGTYRRIENGTVEGALSVTVHPLKQGEAEIGRLWISHDITKREQIAEKLAKSESEYRRLFEESPMPMWVIDTKSFRFLNVNRAASELYGYSKEEFLTMTALDLRTEEDKAHFLSSIAPKIQGQKDEFSAIVRHLKKSGEGINVLIRSHLVQFEGRPARMALMEDITDRLRAKQQLIAANERFHLASEAVTSLIYELDLRTGIPVRSSGLKLLLGFDPVLEPETNTIEWWHSRIHPDDRERAIGTITNLYREKQVYEAEYRILHKDGHWVYVWDRGIVQWDASGNPVRVVGSTQDITKRKSMEVELEGERNSAMLAKEKAEEMTRLKSSFLANMSHEIRTPMTAILGFAEILKGEIKDKELEGYAAAIESSAKRLLGTINTILDHAQIESRGVRIAAVPTNVNREVQRICALLEPLASQRKVRLRFTPAPVDFEASLDPKHFDNIVTNLIGNAIKFTDDGDVTVSVHLEEVGATALMPGFASHRIGYIPAGKHFSITVQDTGIGIAPENLPAIFEEFKQESTGYHRNFEGTGLGLTITSRLVEAMGGSIKVRSAQKVGSEFIVCLPMDLECLPMDLEIH